MTKAAVLERKKRSTAGRRISCLVGKAVEEDETFWNHSTWGNEKTSNGEDSDNSFHESDEDEENRVDTFDSDFNDSESEEEEGSGGKKGKDQIGIEEEDLRRQEKMEQSRKRRGTYREPNACTKKKTKLSVGRGLVSKKRNVSVRKRALKGEGVNAGLVLNFPGAEPLPRVAALKVVPVRHRGLASVRQINRKSTVALPKIGAKRSLRASTITTTMQANEARRQAAVTVASSTSNKTKKQKIFTQEELILEALQVTEADNERWILSRKRVLDEENTRSELKKKLACQNSSKGKIICKMNSRRGCYNTITFPEMDLVPGIFTRSQVTDNITSKVERKKTNLCVVTGKIARYRDPKTMKGYNDLSAFKELRRRFEAGESLERKVVPKMLPSSSGKSNNCLTTKAVPHKLPNISSFRDLTRKVPDKSCILENSSPSSIMPESQKSAATKKAPIIVVSTELSNCKSTRNNVGDVTLPRVTETEKIDTPLSTVNSNSDVAKKKKICNRSELDLNDSLPIPSQASEARQANLTRVFEADLKANTTITSTSSKVMNGNKNKEGAVAFKINVCEDQKGKTSFRKKSNASGIKAIKKSAKSLNSMTSTSNRKKNMAQKDIGQVDNSSIMTNPSAYFENYHSPLASHFHDVAISPTFYNPNFPHPNLHHLVANTDQIPFQFSHPIPSPIDIASIYAVHTPTVLPSVAHLPLSLQNQHIQHTANQLSSISYPQPPHIPESSNMLLPCNITNTANSKKRSKQNAKYRPSKNSENGE